MHKRLDGLLVEKGLAGDLNKAAALAMSGAVTVDGLAVSHAGAQVKKDARVEVAFSSDDYVSRGGLKLEGALDDFTIDISGLECCDIGSSTGGFTECMLRRGASKVYAFDVGRNLMHERIARDPRVTLIENYNFRRFAERRVSSGDMPPPTEIEKIIKSARRCRFVAVDVSFISIIKILEALAVGMESVSKTLALVKPQFELPPRLVPRGVVRDEAKAARAAEDVGKRAELLGFKSAGISASKIKGARGNKEFFVYLVKEQG
ncbi:MAG: TlyA family RNA methyltransferase [Endomicrobiia bacterium]|nr:TlyA family RNA methyltransferase [Endomicrobiia bacterium]